MFAKKNKLRLNKFSAELSTFEQIWITFLKI